MFFFIEALSEAGARLGIPKERAFELVFHTMRGSAELCLEKSIDPAELIQQVATPGGCTVEGLKVFREMNLRSILIECIEKTAQRASELRLES
jgi:pyrroline-5-carboxylate reductase